MSGHMAELGPDVHRTICAVDIAGFGGQERTRPNYVTIRNGMYDCVQQAFQKSGIPWDDCYDESSGDSILALAPPTVAKGNFAGPLPRELVAALRAYNATHPAVEQITLRLALHAGEITYDDHGVTAPAIVHTFRLLDAKPLKEKLANSRAALAMIVSDWFYDDVVRHRPAYEPDSYERVRAQVKETDARGWIRVPEGELEPVADQSVVATPAPPPSAPVFYDVVTALEEIPCLRDEHTRSLVVAQLRPAISGAISYFPQRRAHVTSILRTCLAYSDGMQELLTAIAGLEQHGSVPLNRLLEVLRGWMPET